MTLNENRANNSEAPPAVVPWRRVQAERDRVEGEDGGVCG